MLFALCSFFNFFFNKKRPPANISNTIEVTPTDAETFDEFTIDNLNVILQKISSYQVKVIPNFENKLTSDTVYKEQTCDILTNGGFYDQSNKPLGIFFLDGKQLGKIKSNSFLNGFLSINKSGKFYISKNDDFSPSENLYFYMQSGPLFRYAYTKTLLLNNNPGARRMLIAEDENGEWFIVVIYDQNNLNDGPEFIEMELIFAKISELNGINFKNILNLDGGNASLFINKDHYIKESSFAGSFFCFTKK